MGKRAPAPQSLRAGSGSASLGPTRHEQAADPGDIGGAGAAGEQAVVTDAVEAVWQYVEQEAADELVRRERLLLIHSLPFAPARAR